MCSIQTIAIPLPPQLADRRRRARSASASVRPPPISSSSRTCGFGRERAGELEPLAVEQAERLGPAVRDGRQAAQLEHLDDRVVARRGAGAPPPVVAPTRTFSNTVMPPNGRGTWCVRADAEPAARAAPTGRDVGAPEADAAAVGALRAGEDVQQRRLARAVGADDADRLAGPHGEVDAVEHDERAEALARRPTAASSARAVTRSAVDAL